MPLRRKAERGGKGGKGQLWVAAVGKGWVVWVAARLVRARQAHVVRTALQGE